MADQRPELQIDVTEVRLQRTLRQPKNARQWSQVEDSLSRAEKSLGQRPEYDQKLTLLRANLYAARGDLDRAQEVVRGDSRTRKTLRTGWPWPTSPSGKDPNGSSALKILDDAEKELGASVPIDIARLTYWSLRGGAKAKAEVAKLAEFRKALKPEEQRVYLLQAGLAMRRLNEPGEARNYWVELAKLTPEQRAALERAPRSRHRGGRPIRGRDAARADQAIRGRRRNSLAIRSANYLIDRHRRAWRRVPGGSRTDLEEAGPGRTDRRAPQGVVGIDVLEAQIAELKPDVDVAIEGYKKALERGNTNPEVVKRLLALLNQQDRYDEIYRLAEDLRNRPDAPQELKLATGYKAILDRDYRGAIELAREIFPEQSLRYSDHLAMGRLYDTAIPGKLEDAGKEFRRAVELGAGAPTPGFSTCSSWSRPGSSRRRSWPSRPPSGHLAGKGSDVILAECCMMVGENREAEALIRGSFKERPDDPQTSPSRRRLLSRDGEDGRGRQIPGSAHGSGPRERLRGSVMGQPHSPRRLSCGPDRRQTGKGPGTRRGQPEGQSDSTASLEDRTLKARIMATRAKTTEDAIKILKPLDDAGRLGPDEQFLLAQLYLNGGEMTKISRTSCSRSCRSTKTQTPNPHYISTYMKFLDIKRRAGSGRSLAGRPQEARAEGAATLEQQASLIKARNPGRPGPPGIREMLEAYGRKTRPALRRGYLAQPLRLLQGSRTGLQGLLREGSPRGKPSRNSPWPGSWRLVGTKLRTSDAMAILTSRPWKTCPAPGTGRIHGAGSL